MGLHNGRNQGIHGFTACIQSLQERIELTDMKQKEIQQTQEAQKKYEQEMKKNDKFYQ